MSIGAHAAMLMFAAHAGIRERWRAVVKQALNLRIITNPHISREIAFASSAALSILSDNDLVLALNAHQIAIAL